MLGTGDSDFTPLVHKLRELNKRVIGVGVEASTSALLPPACDEFLFYERLEGVDPPSRTASRSTSRRAGSSSGGAKASKDTAAKDEPAVARADAADLGVLVTQTLAGLERSASGPVLASMLKRTILRKDPTFNEANYGFRGFGELLRHLAATGVVELGRWQHDRRSRGELPEQRRRRGRRVRTAAEHRRAAVGAKSGPPHLSGLKTQMRKTEPDFSEKRFGYGGFLQFAKAARARGLIEMELDESADDYVVRVAQPKS